MSVPFSQNQIEESQTHVFAEYLYNSPGKNWVAVINNMSFIPDYCIIRQITYTEDITNGGFGNPRTYVIYANLSGGYDFLGCFNAPGNATIINSGSAGCSVFPNTVIKVHQRPTQNVNFQILTPSHVAGVNDTLTNADDCNGDLCILVEFIKLKK